ncbi:MULTISPECIES: hypothetical protein [Burkholderia]|uniref:hypothetical protein n=1 Tax=Burkholderia TaxID=32008 RepID=UPI001581CBC1|nr:MULTISPECIES: hypothetical protein [Burkholderia]
MSQVPDYNAELRRLIERAGLTQIEALRIVNNGQAFPIALSTWKAYLALPDSARRRFCPKRVVEHARRTIGRMSSEIRGMKNDQAPKGDG